MSQTFGFWQYSAPKQCLYRTPSNSNAFFPFKINYINLALRPDWISGCVLWPYISFKTFNQYIECWEYCWVMLQTRLFYYKSGKYLPISINQQAALCKVNKSSSIGHQTVCGSLNFQVLTIKITTFSNYVMNQ